MRADVSERFPAGNRPAVIVLPNNNTIPEHLRGKSVMGRADYHAYQGIIINSRSQVIWRGRHRQVCAPTGSTRIRGKTYIGKAVSNMSDGAAKSAALIDAQQFLTELTGR